MLEWLLKFITSSKFIGTVLVVAVSSIIMQLIRAYAVNYINKHKRKANDNLKKKLTILNVTVSLLKYIVFLVDVVIIFSIFGVKVGAFLAGLGIFGIVIGLALQDLLKDFIAGIFIILDNQFSVGDYIAIDGFRGEVINVGLKVTKLRSYEGDVKILSNRNIQEVTNFSQSNSKTVVLFTFNSDENLLNLEDTMNELLKRCNKKGFLPDAMSNLQYKGIETYESGKLVLKLTVDVKALKEYKTKSIIIREAKILFDERGIKTI